MKDANAAELARKRWRKVRKADRSEQMREIALRGWVKRRADKELEEIVQAVIADTPRN